MIKLIFLVTFLPAFIFFTKCTKDPEKVLPSLEVKQKSISFAQGGETKTVQIVANDTWTVSIPSDARSWLSANSSSDQLEITAVANPNFDTRETIVTVNLAELNAQISVSQFGINPQIIPSTQTLEMNYSGGVYEIVVASNVEYTMTLDETANWLKEAPAKKSGLTDKVFYIEGTPNYTDSQRSAQIVFAQTGGDVSAQVKIIQKPYDSQTEPLPVGDEKIDVKSVWASASHSSDPPASAIDGDKNTMWHSPWNNVTNWPITAIFYFENAGYMDYLTYYPRTDGGSNGNFKEFELYVSYIENPNRNNPEHWELYGKYNFNGDASPSEINFNPALDNPTAIMFEILSGQGDNANGFASCAEMEFYRKKEFDVDLSLIFTDDIYSELNPGISEEEILANDKIPHFFKHLALQLISGDYSPYRVQSYQAYRPVSDLSQELKISGYNQYENPTGIWLEQNKDVYVFVSDTQGEKINFIYRNWTTGETGTQPLKSGINLITPTSGGQAYISYFTKNYATAAPIKIHIAGGKINGYFDRNKNTADEWNTILNSAVGDHLDIVGNYTQCIFHIPSLKNHCPNDGMRLIEIYDEIIEMEFELMGFFKYDRTPKNRMLGRNMPGGYMHADGLGAAFTNQTMGDIGNPDKIVKNDNSWGIAHEYGHVNQIRPGLRWIGTVECTNNIYSSYVQYILTSKYDKLHLRLEHETCTDIQGGSNVIGGRFNSHLHYGVLKGDNWLFQWGQDGISDHFVKLVPMWQLNLYFKVAQGTPWHKPDWYADICEDTRMADDANLSNGQHQINFIKRACKHTETDLTDFFEKAGMLKPVNATIDDYGEQKLTITQEMCDEVMAYVQSNGWKKPTGMINYISGNTVKIYEKRLPVEGTLNAGISGSGTVRTIDHKVWKNAVVYETCKENQVVRLTMAGTGETGNQTTIVPYPTGSTKIVAVAWDGTRTTVYEP